jgi:hypothetical protein
MSEDPRRPADPEQPSEGFAEGEADREAFPEDERIGRFSEGQEELGVKILRSTIRGASAKARRS